MTERTIDTKHPDYEVDAIGKPCPMPLLLLKKQLKKVSSKQIILVKSSDPHSEIDISRYCQLHALNMQMFKLSDSEFHYLIES